MVLGLIAMLVALLSHFMIWQPIVRARRENILRRTFDTFRLFQAACVREHYPLVQQLQLSEIRSNHNLTAAFDHIGRTDLQRRRQAALLRHMLTRQG